MTTTGDQLVTLSGLPSAMALTHFAAITTSGYPTPAQIAAAVLAAAVATPIRADVRLVRGQSLVGSGVELDPWGPA